MVSGDDRKQLEKSWSQRYQTTIPDCKHYQDDLGNPTHGKHFTPRKTVEIIIFNDSLIVKSRRLGLRLDRRERTGVGHVNTA